MTNFDFWKDRLAEMAGGNSCGIVAVVNDKPVRCSEIADCKKCNRSGKCTEAQLIKWLLEEHVEKPKMTKKERMFCELANKGWIARDKDCEVWWWEVKPVKCKERWTYSNKVSEAFSCNGSIPFEVEFPFVKWEDEEPWSVEDLLKLEVEQ